MPQSPTPEPERIAKNGDSHQKGETSIDDEAELKKMRDNARNRVNQIRTLEEAKEVLFSLCDSGEEWILAKIAK